MYVLSIEYWVKSRSSIEEIKFQKTCSHEFILAWLSELKIKSLHDHCSTFIQRNLKSQVRSAKNTTNNKCVENLNLIENNNGEKYFER